MANIATVDITVRFSVDQEKWNQWMNVSKPYPDGPFPGER